jgi:hypothetical protein
MRVKPEPSVMPKDGLARTTIQLCIQLCTSQRTPMISGSSRRPVITF